MIRNALIGLAIIVVVIVGGAYLTLRNGLAADRPPGAIETAVARRLVWLSIPASTRTAVNPLANDPEAWRSGAEHFAEHCALCHAADGRGSRALAAKMYPPVPNLADEDVQGLSDGVLFAAIRNGVRWTGMPAFRSDHDDEEIWRLVAFIRHLPSAPNAG